MALHMHRQDVPVGPDRGRSVLPSLDEIIGRFSLADSKAEILEGFLTFARRCFTSVACFAVGQGVMSFLVCEGLNIRPPKIGGRPIPIDRVTVFRRCAANNMPYQGPVPAGEDEKGIFRHIVRELPDEFWIYPGQISDAVDCLFYAERPLGLRELHVDRFEFVIGKTILAMRLLYLRKQLGSKA